MYRESLVNAKCSLYLQTNTLDIRVFSSLSKGNSDTFRREILQVSLFRTRNMTKIPGKMKSIRTQMQFKGTFPTYSTTLFHLSWLNQL